MTNQAQKKLYNGPLWPLGLIVVPTPGTPVNIMSLVDTTLQDAPGVVTKSTTQEYTVRAYGIIFTACKAGASHGLAQNAGNVYILRPGVSPGTGNRDDTGSMIYGMPQSAATAGPFPTFVLKAAPLNRNVFNPYDFSIDAENANDGCLVSLLIQ